MDNVGAGERTSMKKAVSVWILGAITLAVASIAGAAPFSATYTDTISSFTGFYSDINTGEQAKVTIVFDNGGSTAASQTWTAANVQCVIFTFNNAGNKFAAINYAVPPLFPVTTGTFTTDGSGQLQSATIDWEDNSDGITNPVAFNIAGMTGVDPIGNWFLNGANDVFDTNVGEINFTNVANDTQVTNWSNPVSATGVCASFFPSAPRTTSIPVPVPTLSSWAVMILSIAIGIGVVGLRRLRG